MFQKVAVVGLGYVGLPLAVGFGRCMPTLGFDLDSRRLDRYRQGIDPNGNITAQEFAEADSLSFTDEPQALAEADAILVAVPTPIDEAHRPDLKPLQGACITIGRHLSAGATVIFESTVYPGCTEEFCIPLLENASGLVWSGRDEAGPESFHVGYSPERINPGDREHRLQTVIKVVAGDSAQTLDRVAALYESVVSAGVHRAASIAVAEAAKVIENTQRDLNIALMNELAQIFDRMGIDTLDVLEAAGTKWNFLPFRPGLVGGHCIGVDPFYLTYKAEMLGHHPQVILAGRKTNDGMGKFVAEQTVKQLLRRGRHLRSASVIVLGLAFKEDCPDIRNSRVADLITELREYQCDVQVYDPLADGDEAMAEYGIELASRDALAPADAVVLAVPHREFLALGAGGIAALLKPQGVFVDVKSRLDRAALDAEGVHYWRL